MAFNPFTIIKSLLIKEENTLTPKQIEIVPGGTANTKTTLVGSQTTNKTVTLPDATDTLVGKATTDVLTNKTFDADGTGNVLSNVDDGNIKAGAAINATKIHDGSVDNTEFGYLSGVTSAIQTQLDGKASTGSVTTVQTNLDNHINDTTDAHDASAISVVPAGNLTSTDVQAALEEIQTEIDNLVPNAANETLSNLVAPTAINQDLLPDADGTRDLGSATLEFAQGHINQILSATDLVLNPTNDIDANNKIIKNVAAPTAASHAANKEYVDSLSAGLDPKQAVRVASTTDIGGSYATTPSNGRFTGAATSIDGETLAAGDRVLLKDQTDAKQNGIYVYDGSGQFTRSADMDGSPSAEVSAGNYTFTTQGTLNSATGFVLTGNGLITLNTDNLTFTQFSGGSSGASRFLDNLLSPVALNQDLLPGTNNSRDLGSTSLNFKDLYVQGNVNVKTAVQSPSGSSLLLKSADPSLNTASNAVTLRSGNATGLGVSGALTVQSGTADAGTGNVTVGSGADAGGGSGQVTLSSGNSSGSTSGDVNIQTGTAASTRGKIKLDGAVNIVQGVTSRPTSGQQSLTIPSSGNTEGLPILTASDSTTRRVLTTGMEGLPQAPNLVMNGDAEGKLTSSTSILTPYADAAGAIPVDGIGGSPNVTTGILSTNPLSGSKSYTLIKDAANRQGQGWSILDVSVPISMRARVLSVKFDYIVESGTFVAGTPTTDSDVTVWIYDIGNNRVIQPSSYKLLSNSTTVADQFQAEFQTPSDLQSFRLIYHVSTTSTAAYTLKIDNIVVSPSEYVFGSPISGEQTINGITIGAVTTAPTKGTTSIDRVDWHREGQFLVATYRYNQTATAGANNGSGDYLISLPPGLSVDTNLVAVYTGAISALGVGATEIGYGSQWDSGATHHEFFAILYSATQFRVRRDASAGTVTFWGSGTGGLATVNNTFTISIKVPIAGWASTVQMADQTSTRIVAVHAWLSANQSVTANVTNIPFDAKDIDTHNAFSAGVFTVPVSGVYEIKVNTPETVNTNYNLSVYKNGTSHKYIGSRITSGPAIGSVSVQANAGDTLSIRSDTNQTFAGGSISSSTPSYITISRVSGPNQIAASEKVLFSGYVASNTALTANTTDVPFTAIKDTHGAWSTNQFRVPIAGDYQVSCNYFAASGGATMRIYVNGTFFRVISGMSNAAWTSSTTVLENLTAGSTITLRADSSSTITGGTSVTGSTMNIVRIPGSN